MPRSVAKMTIWRMSCLAIASITFDGKRWRSVSTSVFGFARPVSPVGGSVRSRPGFTRFAKHEADDERDRRRDLEVDERLHAHAPDGLHVARPADAEDDRREDERDDEHLDEADEGLREESERLVGPRVRLGRKEMPEDDAEDQRVEDERRRGAPRGAGRGAAHAFCAPAPASGALSTLPRGSGASRRR